MFHFFILHVPVHIALLHRGFLWRHANELPLRGLHRELLTAGHLLSIVLLLLLLIILILLDSFVELNRPTMDIRVLLKKLHVDRNISALYRDVLL